jgi:hypothetical protein
MTAQLAHSTVTKEDSLHYTVSLVVQTRAAIASLEVTLADAKAALLAQAKSAGLLPAKPKVGDGIIVRNAAGEGVEIIPCERRNFDPKALGRKVAKAIFGLITKTVVDHEAYDNAVKAGIIDASLEDAVATKTPYYRVGVV